MAKYKVGDELLIINDPNAENEKLNECWTLNGLWHGSAAARFI